MAILTTKSAENLDKKRRHCLSHSWRRYSVPTWRWSLTFTSRPGSVWGGGLVLVFQCKGDRQILPLSPHLPPECIRQQQAHWGYPLKILAAAADPMHAHYRPFCCIASAFLFQGRRTVHNPVCKLMWLAGNRSPTCVRNPHISKFPKWFDSSVWTPRMGWHNYGLSQ